MVSFRHMGIRGGGNLKVGGEISRRVSTANAHLHRLCLRNCWHTFCQAKTFKSTEGQSAFRTSGTENRDIAPLRKNRETTLPRR